MSKQLYLDTQVEPMPIEKVGKCPKCGSDKSKICWGWAGVYYDLVCENGHLRKINYAKTDK